MPDIDYSLLTPTSRRRKRTFKSSEQYVQVFPMQVQPQARLGRCSRLHCSAVAAVEAPPTQVNIAKDVSELIGQSTLAITVYDPDLHALQLLVYVKGAQHRLRMQEIRLWCI